MPKFITYVVIFSALCAIGVGFSTVEFTTREVYQWRGEVFFASATMFLAIVMMVHRLLGFEFSSIFVLGSLLFSGLMLSGPGLAEPVGTYSANFVLFIYILSGVFLGGALSAILGPVIGHIRERINLKD